VSERQLPVQITLDGQPIASRTRLIELGGYHVALSTVLLSPALAIEVHSSYLGAPGADTRATHLTITPGHTGTFVVSHDPAQLPVTHARERCVLDHLQVLVELATELGQPVGVDLGDHALSR
jgi:hypothetical protein